ncbi:MULTISPECIES: nicotinate-nucleotide adenylyltransferase [unclassified Pseudomonas]|uniref:nicotinate-nucleotide adenylyltransferase n=1 Tax=unclassified Pseudomonas TaxID=196821 RepID=UPI0002722F23|nr:MULTISPECIES: nicotinate-nucleotide adenylyltransferase [unclassified Pseudomonas]EJM21082.1 nicotinate/nicotinamide nucleotide adenylyltransferase [Pseudomonas sp. GM21]MBV7477604.1 nicotinate-nucleotide adenylyltransferase [Pseudomonas sp. PDM31]
MRIGIYGGTFNPIHLGHLSLAQTALESLELDLVVFVPAGIPPLKGTDNLVSAEHRLHMVQLAIAGSSRFCISDFEICRAQKSFTLDTVRHLVQQFPAGSEFFFILGDDCMANLHRWKGIDELREHVTFARARRTGSNVPAPTSALLTIEMPLLDISSTQLRQRLNTGKPADDLTLSSVAQYIQQHHLYRPSVDSNTENNKNEPDSTITHAQISHAHTAAG